jgi:hypothetical protein
MQNPLVFDFFLDLMDVLGDLIEVLLLEIVLFGIGGELRCGQDFLKGVTNNVVFVTCQTHDRVLVLLGNGGAFNVISVLELSQDAR